MELIQTKKKLKTAARGHKLLKDKQYQMSSHFIKQIRKNMELLQEIEELLSAAMDNMRTAEAYMGKNAVYEALMLPQQKVQVKISEKSIMNVNIPDISVSMQKDDIQIPYSLCSSSEALDKAVISINSLIPKLLEFAEAQKASNILAAELERTRRRVNALEYVLIPQMEAAIKAISMKLEENERSNLTRLMKIKDLKKE